MRVPAHKLSKVAGSVIWWTIAILMTLILVGPFLVMVAASLQKGRQYFTGAWDWFPTHPTLHNYKMIFTRSALLRWTFNSLVISTVPVAGSVAVSLATGYIFARKQFPGRELLFWLLLSSLMIPFQVILAPLYLMMNAIGWIDTYWVLTIPGLVSVTGIFLMRQFVQTIPITLEEAAAIDGCNPWQILAWVIAPLSKTAIATLATLGFISAWNSLLYPLLFTVSEKMRPLTVGLTTFADVSSSFGFNMAAATVNFFPTLVIFLFFQRYFVKGITLGGVKL
jgi:multiple sugar transport system permease protein